MEEGVVKCIEENFKGVIGVECYIFVLSENNGSIIVEVFKGFNIDDVFVDVCNVVDQISFFFVGLELLVVYIQENLGFVISFVFSGDVNFKILKCYGWQVEEDFWQMEGIFKVSLSGFLEEEIEIVFCEKDLWVYGLIFQQVILVVWVVNIEIIGGIIKGEDEELLVCVCNKEYYVEGLCDIIVKIMFEGSVVCFYEIVDFLDCWADLFNCSYLNGEFLVVVMVQNILEEDMIFIMDKVQEYVWDFNEKNDIIEVIVICDGFDVFWQWIDLLMENGLLGFGIVLVLLAMFLYWWLVFWVAIVILIFFVGMFVVVGVLGVIINVIFLFGMILVIGILVDDGIVIGENIYQQYEVGVFCFKVVLEGILQVLFVVFVVIVIIVFVFFFFLFIDGWLGDFFL